jgi:thiosulfate/3-mercaptopyruvate sulfurtransferase
MRSGHIPGAHSLPYTDLLNNGALRPPDELRRIFNAAGAARNRPVITSCGSGITAAVINLAALTAGLPEPALYDGSWAEWGGNPNFPVEV